VLSRKNIKYEKYPGRDLGSQTELAPNPDGPCILIPLRNLKDAECGIEDFEEKTHCKLNGEKMRIQTDRIQNEPWEYKYE